MKAILAYAVISAGLLTGVSALSDHEASVLVRTVYAQAPDPQPTPAPPSPVIELPATIKGDVGAFVKITAKTAGKEVRWFSASPGLNVFPGELLRDTRSTVVTATMAGEYKLIAYTAIADVPSDPATCVVVIGAQPPPGPGPGPAPGPGPNPNPQPSGPLAKQMATWLAPVKAKLSKQILTDLATNYESIAAEAVAVQGVMPKSGFVAREQQENVRVLGPDLANELRDPFFKPLAKYKNDKGLAEQDEAGHAELWREIGAAIKEVAAAL